MEMRPKYHITAINKLTGQRESVSGRMSREEVEDLLLQLRRKNSSKRPFKNYKVELCSPRATEFKF